VRKEKKNVQEGKPCSRCKVWKPFSEFYKGKDTKFGYKSECKECSKKSIKVKKSTDEAKSIPREWTKEEIEYLVKFYEHDGSESIGYALGRSARTVRAKWSALKKSGLLEIYKKFNRYA
jgi:hypothetical protein